MPAITRCSRSAAADRGSCWSATSTRCGRIGQLARMPIVRRDGRSARSGHARHEGRACRWDCWRRARCSRPRRPPPARWRCCAPRTRRPAAARRGRSSKPRRGGAMPCSCSSRPSPAARSRPAARASGSTTSRVTGVAAHAGVDPAQGRQRGARAGPADPRPRALHDLERGVSVNAGRDRRRHPSQRRRRRGAWPSSTCGRRRSPMPPASTQAFHALRPHPARRAADGHRRLRASADGAIGGRGGALRPRAGRGGRTRADGGRRRHRRRVRRQLHRGARRADARRTGRASATAPTPCTNTSRSTGCCRARRCWRR